MRDFRVETVKPPYRVPLMTEIAARDSNGLRFVSTFSGCGGSCLGFKMAGWTPLLASEFIPAAQDVYALNNPGVPIVVQDVREMEPALMLEYLGLDQGELELLEGSPPCASFSTAGARDSYWGEAKKYSDTVQRTDDLFYEYARLLRGLKPKAFVAENVTGLVKGVAKGYAKLIYQELVDCGYRVSVNLLDAQWLGVPQARQRIIFIGVRDDLGKQPPKVPYLDYRYTVRDAIPLAVRVGTAPPHADWVRARKDVGSTMVSADAEPCPTIVASGENKGAGYVEVLVPERVIHDRGKSWHAKGDVTDEPCPTITVGVDGLNSEHYKIEGRVVRVPVSVHHDSHGQFHKHGDVSDRPAPTVRAEGSPSEFSVEEVVLGDDVEMQLAKGALEGTAAGREWEKLRPGEKSDRYFNLIRVDPDAPAPTVTAAGGSKGTAGITHPIERRKFTIPELKRICGFPDDFLLSGTYRQQWERLGRAVPPVMMFHVAKAVAEGVFGVEVSAISTADDEKGDS